MAAYFREFVAGKIDIPRCEMLNPQVIVGVDLAVLTYNLLNYVRGAGGAEKAATRWNSTQVYRRVNGISRAASADEPGPQTIWRSHPSPANVLVLGHASQTPTPLWNNRPHAPLLAAFRRVDASAPGGGPL